MARPERPGKQFVGVDMDAADVGRLREIAAADRRNLSSLLRVIVRDWLVWYDDRAAKGNKRV